jgi:hypothetical protein
VVASSQVDPDDGKGGRRRQGPRNYKTRLRRSEYEEKQQQFFTKNFGMVEPKQIRLPASTEDFRRHRTRGDQEVENKKYVVFHLLPQLAQLMKDNGIYGEFKKQNSDARGVYKSFEDGRNFRCNELLKKHPDALQPLIYIDEIQLCNPNGSYNHKIVHVYFSLGNIPAKCR